MKDLSVIIPARNEEFLNRTILDVLGNMALSTEIIAVLDGYLPKQLINDKNVTFIHHPVPIGQRAATNEGVRASSAKYIMKLDGHCAVGKRFDEVLAADCEYGWTVIPRMYNLHAFNWVCAHCGNETMQGPTPNGCNSCGKSCFEKAIVWRPKKHKKSDFMRFDSDLRFGYWSDYNRRPESKGDIADLMCAIGACWFMHRDRYLDLGGLDEAHGSWGQVGVEIACKSWLSGGRHVVNKRTWFSHMFRTSGDFSFPYPIKHSDQERAREYSRDLWVNNRWEGQKRKFEWILDKFAPIPGWEGYVKKPESTLLTAQKDGPLLSVIIPARNEKYLQATIDDICKNFTTNFEVIVGLDGYEPDPPLKPNDRVRIIKSDKRVGMRPLINLLAEKSRGVFIMKVDAHCSFDSGYDQKLIDIYEDGGTVLGIRYELDVKRWERKRRTNCDFRYLSPLNDPLGGLRALPHHEWKKKTKGQKVAESMALSGSGWLMKKGQFEAWGGLDENHGTMFQEGCEIACKTWLSGGRLLINRDTWYAHWNRGKAPYALSTKHRQKSIDYSIEYWTNNKWPLQKYSFNWLIEKFDPPGWEKQKVGGIKARPQGANLKGAKDLSVDELWEKRVAISEPLKRERLEVFFDAFMKFLNGDKTQYFNYLVSHLSKRPLTVVPESGKRHVKNKMRRAMALYNDIKKNGMKTPLEFYQTGGKLTLFRGYRRLCILKKLGVKKTSARVHANENIAKNFSEPYRIKRGSINDLGSKQFIRRGKRSTDKFWVHNYLWIYDNLFSQFRRKKIKMLEIGLLYGASLELWHQAFPKAMIYGLDHNENWKRIAGGLDRIKVYTGKQQDADVLKAVSDSGPYDIIIDDCGHRPNDQWTSFCGLWPALSSGGYYIIEDSYGSFKKHHIENNNVVRRVSAWVDSIYQNSEVKSLQFYYNMCVVQKGVNTEGN